MRRLLFCKKRKESIKKDHQTSTSGGSTPHKNMSTFWEFHIKVQVFESAVERIQNETNVHMEKITVMLLMFR
jgi:hypothetical protein